MLYNRKTLCLLAGIQLEHFKEAARIDPETGIDNLPIVVRDEVAPTGHAKYSELDVLAVAVAMQFSASGGLISRGMPFASAAKIVANLIGTLPDAVKLGKFGAGVHAVGYVTLADGGGFHVSDTLGKIALEVASKYPNEATGLYLVSPAAVAAAIEARAAHAGIEWRTDRLWVKE